MSKPLPTTDFRAVRVILEEHEYATGGEEIPPTDLIERDIWHGMMDLPDDVAIRITNHHGTKFRLLYGLWGDWLQAIGRVQDNLFNPMLDAADCFEVSAFEYSHGFYRAAIANLRSAFELVMLGALGTRYPADETFNKWKDGDAEIGFSYCRRKFFAELSEKHSGLFKPDGLLRAHYHELCKYAHSRPNASDGDLWQSNGPVYNGNAIVLVMSHALYTYVICYSLVKVARPKFKLPPDSKIIFELEAFPWHKAANEIGKAVSLI